MGKSSDETESERSPLLRAMRNSYHEETIYSSIHTANSTYTSLRSSGDGDNLLRGMRVFRPIIYAEQALSVLLNSAMIYVSLCFIGFGLICLNADGILGPSHNWNWWIVFLPFWIGNIVLFVAHVMSLRAATKLRQWADTDSMSNEPLLPLLRKILLLYAVSIPLCILLLWSEVAFCGILSETTAGISVYVAFTPLLVIELGYITRYLLCKSRSTLPGLSWMLLFAFTIMLSYNADVVKRFETSRTSTTDSIRLAPLLPWIAVFSPLFVLQFLLFSSLVVVLYSEAVGWYKMNSIQVISTLFYTMSLASAAIGQVMLVEHMEFDTGTVMDVPSILLFAAWITGSIGLYMICRQESAKLMASRGGAVPVPLTRTAQGWVTNHAVTDQWMLLGDIPLTDIGIQRRIESGERNRTASDIESEMNSDGLTFLRQFSSSSFFIWCCCLRSHRSIDTMSSDEHPESRLNQRKRRNSGSYSELTVDDDGK